MSVLSVCYFARFSLLFGVVGGSSERIIRIIFFQSERETIYRQTFLYRMAENYYIYVSTYIEVVGMVYIVASVASLSILNSVCWLVGLL